MGYFGIPFRNGVPIGLGSVASFGAQQFDPSSLFIGGTVGTFYDPSDPATLFTTSTGTTPCAVPGSGSQVLVGLMLDKSQGAPGALGAELVNLASLPTPVIGNAGTPVTVGVWTAATRTMSSTVTSDNSQHPRFAFDFGLVTNNIYRVQGRLTGNLTALSEVRLATSGTANSIAYNSTTGIFSAEIRGANGTSIQFLFNGTLTAPQSLTIAELSIRQVLGNHAIAFNDTTARPELSARVNLLRFTEDWTNAVWNRLQSGTGVAPVVTNNFATAPDGTQTAIRVQFNLGATPATAISRLFQDGNDGFTTLRTKTIWAKTNDNSTKTIYIQGPQSGNTLLTVTPTWTLFTISDTSPAVAAFAQMQLGLDGSQGTSTTADILFWHPDIRQTNIGSALPSYQRIADQYTYDSNGFPSYLRFDGVDDSMYTPASIPFATVTSDGQARRNLLSNPTQFDAAAWAVNGSTVTANATVSPDGTATADAVISTATTGVHQIRQSATVVNGSNLVFSFYAKANGYNFVRLWEDATTGRQSYFNLVTGVATNVDFASVSIEAAGSGWYRCIATLSAIGGTTAGFRVLMTPDGINTNFAGDGTSGVFLWGAQLETGSTATAFQNIGTDKMSVFAGVRKLSDAVYPVIAELAFDYSANNGSFALFASGNSTPRYGFYLRGSSNTGYEPQTYEAPLTNVLAVSYDIGGAAKANEVLPRINSVLNQTNPVSGADAGTGNFGTYPLYIGSRNNASLRFNGHLYSLIIAGTQLQSGSITATEQYVAGKTGVQI